MALGDEVRHEAEQQRQQQGGDVLAVDVRVRHEDDLVVAELRDVELLVDPGAQGRDDGLDLGVLEHPVEARLLHVEDLATQRKDRLVHGVAAGLRRTAGRVALHDVELGGHRILGAAVRQLARQPAQVGRGLAAHQLARLARRHTRLGRGHRLVHDGLGLRRVGVEPEGHMLVDHALDVRTDLRVAQLRLGLALELRLRHTHGHDRGETLAAVLARELRVLLLDQLVRQGVLVHQRGQRRTETLLVRAALMGVDGVGEGVHRLLVTRVPLHGDLDLVVRTLGVEAHDGRVDGGLSLVQVVDVVHQAVRVVVDDLFLTLLRRLRSLAGGCLGLLDIAVVEGGTVDGRGGVARFGQRLQLELGVADPLILEGDGQALVEERHLLQAARDRVVVEGNGLEDLGVRPEPDRRAGAAGVTAFDQLLRDGVVEVLDPVLAVALDVGLDAGRQGVDHGDTHAVQAAGDRVGIRVELAAGVQLGHDDLDGRRTGGVHLHGNAAAVVEHLHAAVGQQGDFNLGGVTRHRLIDRVVHDLPHQVVQTTGAGRTDVHARTLPDSFEALEDRDR